MYLQVKISINLSLKQARFFSSKILNDPIKYNITSISMNGGYSSDSNEVIEVHVESYTDSLDEFTKLWDEVKQII